MPDELQGKQRWREVPPLPEDERWTLEGGASKVDKIGAPPPLPSIPPLPDSRTPPADRDDQNPRSRREGAAAARGRGTFHPPDELLTESLRRQPAAAQRKPLGANTILAAVLAIGAIGLIVALTMYLAKQN